MALAIRRGGRAFIIGAMRRVVFVLSVLAACGGSEEPAVDGGPPDAAPLPDALPFPDAALVDASSEPMNLLETGLYADLASETLAAGVVEYTVNYPLWADGAAKRRFVFLPPGSTINTADMDQWSLPQGTRLWKEFSRDGVKLETRLLWKQGPTEDDWYTISFAWNEGGTEAIAAPLGVKNTLGTDHDIPGESDCKTCHARQRSFALGFSALQLDHADGQVNLVGLAGSGRLSAPPAGTVAPIFPLPGDATARAALGYLHGNCGPCHNPASDVQIRTPIEWHLETASLATVEDTTIYRTTVGVPPAIPTPPQYISVIEPGDPDVSVAVFRMSQRDPLQDSLIPMPPVATEEQDLDGIEAVSAWAASLP